MTHGGERYTPLVEAAPVRVSAGEYAGVDDEKILCRLDVSQCAETHITKETERFLVYVQGNEATPAPALHTGIRQIGELVVEICGGRYEVIGPQG